MQQTLSDKIRIGVLTNAFREERLIPGCLDQFGFGDAHVVLNSRFPWGYMMNDVPPFIDNTANISEALGAKVFNYHWKNEAEQFNTGLKYFEEKECDWVLIVDADERYTKENIEKLLIFLNEHNHGEINSVKPLHWNVYWRTPDYKIIPDQPHKPIIAIRPTERFASRRHANCSYTFAPVEMHHFSYMRTDEEMYRKIKTFSHKDEIVPHWYEEKWLNWNPKMKSLHPVVPSQFHQAVHDPCPEELLEFLP